MNNNERNNRKKNKKWAFVFCISLMLTMFLVVPFETKANSSTDIQLSIAVQRNGSDVVEVESGDEITVIVNMDKFCSTLNKDKKKLLTTMQFFIPYNGNLFEYVDGSMQNGSIYAINALTGEFVDVNIHNDTVKVAAVYRNEAAGALKESDNTQKLLAFRLRVKDTVEEKQYVALDFTNVYLKNLYIEEEYRFSTEVPMITVKPGEGEPDTPSTDDPSGGEPGTPELDDPSGGEPDTPEPDNPSGGESGTPEPDDPSGGEPGTPEPDDPSGGEPGTPEPNDPSGGEPGTPDADDPSGGEPGIPEPDDPSGGEPGTPEPDEPSGGEPGIPEPDEPSGGEPGTPEPDEPSGGESDAPSTDKPSGGESDAPSTDKPSGGEPDTPSTDNSGQGEKTPTKIKLSKPTGIKAVATTYNKISVSWNPVEGAAGYEVYRYDAAKKQYVLIKKVATNSVVETKLDTGKKYQYRVRGYAEQNGENIYGPLSDMVSAKPKLGTTTIKVKKNKSGSVTISWKKTKGANGYIVYRAKSKKGKYKKIKTVKKLKYVNKGLSKGKKYYYKVVPYRNVNGKRVNGLSSAVKSVKIS